MIVTVTYNNNNGGLPYNAASVKTPFATKEEALEYAFRWTQNISGSWSNKEGDDANDNVEVLHYKNDGSGLRSSMVGDHFTVDGETFEVAMFGFTKASGDYLVFAARHMFKRETYDISLQCVKMANYDT